MNNFSFGIRGQYKTITGMVWRVDIDLAQAITVDAATIQFQDITRIESENHIFEQAWEDADD